MRVIGLDENWLRLRWRVEGSQRLVVPAFSGKGRADELWRTTCFEAFLRAPGAGAYVEINLSPSERWQGYDLAHYRAPPMERAMPREPDCTLRAGSSFAIFDAAIPVQGLPPLPWQMGLCAVIEEQGGAKSYWAVTHPDGPPDFHDPACQTLRLEAPGAA